MNYLMRWKHDILGRHAVAPEQPATVEGTYDKHLGPRWAYAKVMARITPSDRFEVVFGIPDEQGKLLQRDGSLDQVVFGFLDVLLTAKSSPVTLLRLEINGVDYDPVRSSASAFRMAGRDAAQKALGLRAGMLSEA